MVSIDLLQLIVGALISIASVAVAVSAFQIRRRQPWAQALFQVVNLLESDEVRVIRRRIIYSCPRELPANWFAEGMTPEATRAAIDKWGAFMDMLSLLYFTRQFHKVKFFEMYGDVIIRTAYKLAPYAYQQRMIRGEQFWLPFQELTVELLQIWKKQAHKGRYPMRIGIPNSEDKVSREMLISDEQFRTFLQGNRLRVR